MLYLTVIIAANVLIILFNVLFSLPTTIGDVLKVALSSVIGTASVIAVDGIIALIIRRALPEKLFGVKENTFNVSKKERGFYRKIKVNKWKDKVPELGGFTGFHKDKIKSPNDPEYLARFVLEANYGAVIHIANALLGWLIAFIPFCGAFSVWFPIFVVNFVLSMMPVAVLRNNVPSLKYLYFKAKKTEDADRETKNPIENEADAKETANQPVND